MVPGEMQKQSLTMGARCVNPPFRLLYFINESTTLQANGSIKQLILAGMLLKVEKYCRRGFAVSMKTGSDAT